ncbi:hypothetical cytosolic protein [Syntrophus aciditrophicus SB]|uniref:Hypothetical cytosolic protein n=1 Tax=Syntrophus aciditrophicus (strain SB) TaxID=56780 RepID=Q2LVQ1_SYNAS|nr:hypothetical cytosolic protein [Syntrophus aciditrophicus SB]
MPWLNLFEPTVKEKHRRENGWKIVKRFGKARSAINVPPRLFYSASDGSKT